MGLFDTREDRQKVIKARREKESQVKIERTPQEQAELDEKIKKRQMKYNRGTGKLEPIE